MGDNHGGKGTRFFYSTKLVDFSSKILTYIQVPTLLPFRKFQFVPKKLKTAFEG